MKKINLLIILILGLICSPLAIAFEGVGDEVSSNWNSQYSNNPIDLRVNSQDMIEDIETKNDASIVEYKNKVQEKYAGKLVEADEYFKEYTLTSCESPDDYVCPSLTDEKRKEGYRTRLSFLDLKSGRIGCSVIEKLEGGATQNLTVNSEKVIYSKTFVNKGCVEKYSSETNKDDSETIKGLITQNNEFIKELQEQEFKYTVDYKMNGADEFLDLADVLDGIVTFNPEIFDLENSLLTRELKTQSGFTTLPNETIITKFEQNLKSWGELFSATWNGDSFVEKGEMQSNIRDVAASVANSSYFMLLDFFIKSNEFILNIVVTLAFVFILYNVSLGWVMPTIFNKAMKKDSGENNPQRGVYGVLMVIMLFSAEVENINLEYLDAVDGTVRTELIQEQTKLQALVQLLSSETNRAADVFAQIGIRAWLNGLNASSGLFDEAQINALATEKIILTKEKSKLEEIDKEMCAGNYSISNLKDRLIDYRKKTLEEENKDLDNGFNFKSFVFNSGDDISTLEANPYPKSEREAANLYRKNYGEANPDSPYQMLVKQNSMNKFTSSEFSPMSLSACYNNRKKMITNDSRLREIDEQFATFNSNDSSEGKVQYLKLVNDLQWSMYAKQGYLAIAYLPATAILVDSIGIVGDIEKQQEALNDATKNNDDGFVANGATDLLKTVGEDMAYLTLFGGYNIAKMVHPVKDWLFDKVINVISVATGGVGKFAKLALSAKRFTKKYMTMGKKDEEIDLIDLKIASLIIQNIFKTLIVVTLIVGTILIFTLLFIEKLFAFIASMFLLIYAFSKNQEDRVGTALAKIFAVYFKTVLIVICVFLALYSLSLVNVLETLFINGFFNSMDLIENASWEYKFDTITLGSFSGMMNLITLFLKKYIFYGISKLAFAILKIILAVQMIWKMPSYMYELIYEKVHSVSDSVADTLQNATDAQTMRV